MAHIGQVLKELQIIPCMATYACHESIWAFNTKGWYTHEGGWVLYFSCVGYHPMSPLRFRLPKIETSSMCSALAHLLLVSNTHAMFHMPSVVAVLAGEPLLATSRSVRSMGVGASRLSEHDLAS